MSSTRSDVGSCGRQTNTTPRPIGPGTIAFGFTALLSLLGFIAVLLFVRANPRSRGDLAASLRLQRNSHPALVRSMGWISWFGFRPQSLVIPFLLVVINWFRGPRLGSVFLVFAWASSLLSFFTKLIIKRPRPDNPLIRVAEAKIRDTSFPSGHTLHYMTFWGFVAYLAATNLRNRTVGRATAAGIAAMIGLVGPSRIYLGHHWLTDVLASYLLGLAYFSGLVVVYRWLRSMLDGEPEPQYYEEETQPSPPAPLPILGEGSL